MTTVKHMLFETPMASWQLLGSWAAARLGGLLAWMLAGLGVKRPTAPTSSPRVAGLACGVEEPSLEACCLEDSRRQDV